MLSLGYFSNISANVFEEWRLENRRARMTMLQRFTILKKVSPTFNLVHRTLPSDIGIFRKRRPRFLLSWMNDMTMVQLKSLYDSTLLVISLACVAWRFWLGALSNKGGRGQRNREEIGAGATWQNRQATQAIISYKANLGTRKVVTCTYSIFFVCLFVFVVSRRLFFKKEKFCVFDKKKKLLKNDWD